MKFNVAEETEMAKHCSTWQQLDLMKRRKAERMLGENAKNQRVDDMTRSEKLIWYKNNQNLVEEDRERTRYCSNYRQLQLARGKGRLYDDCDSAQMGDIDKVRSKRLQWYRSGGDKVVDAEMELSKMCSNWRQFYLLSRPRVVSAEEEAEEELREPTRSEKLVWYKNGGSSYVEGRKGVANNSQNWIQFKLTMDAEAHACKMQEAVQTKYSEFISKEALSDHMMNMRRESREERDELRKYHRTRESRESVTREAYGYRVNPFDYLEIEEASAKSYAAMRKIQEKEESLRQTTEEMMCMRTQYMESARELALRAIKEDEEAVAASRTMRRTTVVQQNQAVTKKE